MNRLRSDDILQGLSDSPLRATVGIGDGEQTADIYLSEDDPNIRIVGIPELSNPYLHQAIISTLEKGANLEIRLSANLKYNPLNSKAAILRAGYLLMFYYFGYGYILHESASIVREILSIPELSTDWHHGLLWFRPVEPRNFIGLLMEPRELKCFIALLDLSTKIERCVGVVLPGLGPEETDIYQRWAAIDEKDIRTLEPEILPLAYDRKALADPKLKYLPYKIWKMHR